EPVRKALLALPNRNPNLGKYSVLRVVASFPGIPGVDLESCTKKGVEGREKATLEKMPHWDDEHPLASLNMDYVATLTQHMSPLKYI
ncbi:hypothetical protein C8R45DRAFT_791340, partial [Mycena sanguinolenta]